MSKTLNKVAYKPVGILMGIAAGALAGVVFKQVWKLDRRRRRRAQRDR